MTTEGGAGYMNGLFIYKDKKYIDQVVGTSTLSLLAKKDDFEIMLYEIKADRPNSITPGDFPDLMEFYYIIEGALEIKDGGNFVKLNKGDYFFVSNIKETVPVRTIEDTKMLYLLTVSFHLTSLYLKSNSFAIIFISLFKLSSLFALAACHRLKGRGRLLMVKPKQHKGITLIPFDHPTPASNAIQGRQIDSGLHMRSMMSHCFRPSLIFASHSSPKSILSESDETNIFNAFSKIVFIKSLIIDANSLFS